MKPADVQESTGIAASAHRRARPAWQRSIWARCVLSATVVIIGLLFIEFALRVKGSVSLPPYPIQCPHPEYQSHPQYGYCLRPNISTTNEYPKKNPRTLRICSNSDGFRGLREFGGPDTRPRVLIIGDSFVFGQGVEHEERFTDVLESNRPDWRVENLGMTGYGPDLMLMAFQSLGRKIHAKAMVLCIYTDDFRRVQPRYASIGFSIPRFRLIDGGLQRVPYPARSPWDGLHAVCAVRNAWWKITQSEWRLTAAILESTLSTARQFGTASGIAFLPGKADLPEDQARRRWLGEFARQHATPFVDLTDPIHAYGENAFITANWHLSPLGHRVVADELQRFITDHQLLD